jgi:hypothetical protein
VAASSLSDELVLIAPEVLHDVKARYGAFRESADFGQLEWRTMLRLLERNSVEYRC